MITLDLLGANDVSFVELLALAKGVREQLPDVLLLEAGCRADARVA